jgi:hypothetical protein
VIPDIDIASLISNTVGIWGGALLQISPIWHLPYAGRDFPARIQRSGEILLVPGSLSRSLPTDRDGRGLSGARRTVRGPATPRPCRLYTADPLVHRYIYVGRPRRWIAAVHT